MVCFMYADHQPGVAPVCYEWVEVPQVPPFQQLRGREGCFTPLCRPQGTADKLSKGPTEVHLRYPPPGLTWEDPLASQTPQGCFFRSPHVLNLV